MNTGSAMTAFTARRNARRSFTLTELMVAVAVLIVVIIATSKIFGTASKITGLGQATASIMQEAATIERQLRDLLEHLSNEGFLCIHSVSVANNVKGAGQPLLDPNRAPTAIIRADQIVFFTTATTSMQTYRLSDGSQHKGQGNASRVYFGHAWQFPQGLGFVPDPTDDQQGHAYDVSPSVAMTPWTKGNVGVVKTLFSTIGAQGANTQKNIFSTTVVPGTTPADQPQARQWLLALQNVMLGDDDSVAGADTNAKTFYLQNQTARSIFFPPPGGADYISATYGFTREIRNGRVDGAASLLNDIRRFITIINPATGGLRPWSTGPISQRKVIQDATYYPRAERVAPSMNRVDQALTNNVISSGCSSVVIDWTYENGVGAYDANNDGDYVDVGDFLGVRIPQMLEQPWFGLPDTSRGVYTYASLPATGTGGLLAAQTILPVATYPNNIESSTAGLPVGVTDYWATFGYNQTRPVDAAGALDATLGYTPFPSAIRITLTLHDPEGKLEGGREFQFVINLPKQNR